MADRLSRRAALMLGVAGSLALPGVVRAEPGVVRRPDHVRPVGRLRRAGGGAGPRHAPGHPRRLRRGERRRRRERAQARARVLRRRLRAGAGDRQLQAPDRPGPGLRPAGRGRHAHVEGGPADRDGSARAVHRAVLRRPLPARPGAGQRHQRPGVLRPGDRGLGRAPDGRPRDLAGRPPLPGRLVRPRRPLRPGQGAGQAVDGPGRRGHLHAQHDRGEDRPPGDPQRQAAGRGPGRHLRGVRRVRQAGAQDRARRGLRQPLLRRQRRPRQGAREGRRGGRDHAGRAVPRGHRHPARGRLPEGGAGRPTPGRSSASSRSRATWSGGWSCRPWRGRASR